MRETPRRGALLVGGLGLLLLLLSAPSLALKPLRGYPARPADYGIRYEEITIPTTDGLRLRAWFYPAQDSSGIAHELIGRRVPVPEELRPPARGYVHGSAPRGAVIVIAPGDAGNMTQMIFYADHFFTRGFHVLTFDWRGFGESDPWPIEENLLCYPEFLEDFGAALDTLRARPEVDPERIGLLGFSTGAYLAFAMAAQREEIGAFAGRALISSFEDLLPILARLDPQRGFRAPSGYREDLLPVHAAPRVTAPVLLITGENDRRTPPWMAERVLARLGGPKRLWIVPGATHGGPTGPELTDYPAFFERVVAFFATHLQGE